jgi:hypothetical protein
VDFQLLRYGAHGNEVDYPVRDERHGEETMTPTVGHTVYFYSKGVRHYKGCAQIEAVNVDGNTLHFTEKLPDGVSPCDVILTEKYEPIGDVMREILKEFNETRYALGYNDHLRGGHAVIHDRGNFRLEPFKPRNGYDDRYWFQVRPEIISGQRFWSFNVLAW